MMLGVKKYNMTNKSNRFVHQSICPSFNHG